MTSFSKRRRGTGRRRWARTLAAASGVALCAVLAPATTSSASTAAAGQETSAADLLVCTGTHTLGYSPGLILTPRPTVTTGEREYTGCLAPTEPTITSGTYDFVTAPADRSCLTALSTDAGSSVIEWGDGRTSTLSWTEDDILVENILGQQIVTVVGTVSAGVFAGHAYENVTVSLSLDLLACVGTGITSSSGTAVLTILT